MAEIASNFYTHALIFLRRASRAHKAELDARGEGKTDGQQGVVVPAAACGDPANVCDEFQVRVEWLG